MNDNITEIYIKIKDEENKGEWQRRICRFSLPL